MATVVTLVEEEMSFIKKRHELDKLLKTLTKASDSAVETLIRLMEDDKTDDKIKMDCAVKLIGFQTEVVKDINADSIQRLVAELKLVRAPSKSLVEQPNRPRIDFNTIQTV